MVKEQVLENINSALIMLYNNDNYILQKNGSERSIAHCLASHLKALFPDYDVDCEYNINIDSESGKKEIVILTEKMLELNKKIARRRSIALSNKIYYYVSVYPDIIVHKRGRNDKNLIVFELKKSTFNLTKELDYDRLKLEKYTANEIYNELKYKYGVFINIHVDKEEGYQFDLEVYQNGSKTEDNYQLSYTTLP